MAEGEHDFSLFHTFYPGRSENLTNGIYVDDSAIDIISVFEEEEKHKFVRPDLLIYSTSVYWIILAFIILWSVLNIQATLMETPIRRLTLIGLTKRLLTNAFDLTTGHIGVVNTESPSKVLQLALLLSVTLILSIYGACFSNENIQVKSPKIYNSYQSLAEDPPDIIVTSQYIMDLVEGMDDTVKTTERYLKQVSDNFYSFSRLELEKIYENEMKHLKIAGLSLLDQPKVHGLHFIIKLRAKSLRPKLVLRQDADASRTLKQLIVSKSLLRKPGGKKIVKTLRKIQETGLVKGLKAYFEANILKVPSKTYGPLYVWSVRKHSIFDLIISNKKEVETLDKVSLKILEFVFHFLLALLALSALVLLTEVFLVRESLPIYVTQFTPPKGRKRRTKVEKVRPWTG